MSVSLCRLSMLIDAAFGEFCQGYIRLFFLGQGSLQQPPRFIQPQFLRPGLQRPVARDFVMLDRLSGRKQTRVQSRATPIFLNYLLPVLDDADNAVASLTARRLIQFGKHLIEALDMALVLALTICEFSFQLVGLRGRSHLV